MEATGSVGCPGKTDPPRPRVTAKGEPSLCGSGFGRQHLRESSHHVGPSLSATIPGRSLAALGKLEPSLLNQWPCVCGLNPAPSDEPTSLGMSAEGSLRRAIVPPFKPAVSVDEGHSLPRTFANKQDSCWAQMACGCTLPLVRFIFQAGALFVPDAKKWEKCSPSRAK